jgi:serine/threonine protein kinase
MLAKFRHPNIVLLVGICSISPNLAIITEYIERGSLYDILHKKKTKLSDNDKRMIVKQILSSLTYLHEHEVVHRDIKSHNFLVDDNLTVKLCDFGLARHKSTLNQGSMQFSGTPVYMAQELFMKKSYDHSVDVFALGTLIYEIYTG